MMFSYVGVFVNFEDFNNHQIVYLWVNKMMLLWNM